MRCEARTLDDIRALGGNDAADERRFATAARVSEINLVALPRFRAAHCARHDESPMAEWMQQMHPLRLQYELFSNANPMMATIAAIADRVRNDRKPVAAEQSLCRHAGERFAPHRRCARRLAGNERSDCRTHVPGGLRFTGAANGRRHRRKRKRPLRKASKNLMHQDLLQKRIAELKSRIPAGGLREALMRGLLYAGMARGAVDERGFEAVRRIRKSHGDMPLAAFKALVREQFNILLIDTEAALAAIPSMLPPDAETRRKVVRTDQDRARRARRNHDRRLQATGRGRPAVRRRRRRRRRSDAFSTNQEGAAGAGIVTMHKREAGMRLKAQDHQLVIVLAR